MPKIKKYKNIKGNKCLISKKHNLLITASKKNISFYNLENMELKTSFKIKGSSKMILSSYEEKLFYLDDNKKIGIIDIQSLAIIKEFDVIPEYFDVYEDVKIENIFFYDEFNILIVVKTHDIYFICNINIDSEKISILDEIKNENFFSECFFYKDHCLYLIDCFEHYENLESIDDTYFSFKNCIATKTKKVNLQDDEIKINYLQVIDSNCPTSIGIFYINPEDDILIIDGDYELLFASFSNFLFLSRFRLQYETKYYMVNRFYDKNYKKYVIIFQEQIKIFDLYDLNNITSYEIKIDYEDDIEDAVFLNEKELFIIGNCYSAIIKLDLYR